MSFDYLENGWFSSGDELQQCQQQLFHAIDSRLHSADMLPFVVQLPQEFIDEHAKVSYCRHLDCIIRTHRSTTTYVDAAYCYRLSSLVCQSLGLSVTVVSPAKMA